MNLLDVLLSVVIVGIIVSHFSYLPNDTHENIENAKRMVNYSTVINEVAIEIDNHMGENPEEWLDVALLEIEEKYEGRFDQPFSLEWEVLTVEDKEFFKIQVLDRYFTQEYYYARVYE